MKIYHSLCTKIRALHALPIILLILNIAAIAQDMDIQEKPNRPMNLTAPFIITIHDSVQTIEDDASCDKSRWKNNTTDACECCLVNHQNMLGATKTADEIVQSCIQETKQCTEKSVAAVKQNKKLAKGSSDQLLTALSDDVIVRPMVFDTSLLTENGSFTEQSLPQFLAQAYSEKKLNNNDFSKAECIKAKNLGTQGGYKTVQLFLVTTTCSTAPASQYIVKEGDENSDEAINLKKVADLPAMKDIIAPKIKPGFPSIALPFAYFAYPKKQKFHYIAAMPLAKGKAFNELVTTFQQDQTDQNKEVLTRAFQILGKEIANFHKLFMKPIKGKIIGLTMAHGDFHFFNLFFDSLGGHFTFIDNETMEKSHKNKVSPAVDIVKLFFMPFSTDDLFAQFQNLIKGIDLKTWNDIAVKNFAIGYASAYPAKEQAQVLKELKAMFNDPFTIPWVNFNQTQLNNLRKDYINPIFDTLIQNATPKKK